MGETRQEILRTALDLMQAKSFAGFSFQDLAERVGIRKASIYHHFPSKAKLAEAVLKKITKEFSDAVAALENQAPAKRLDTFFDHYGRHLGPGEKICPGGAMSAVWDGLNTEVREAAQTMIKTQQTWMAKAIREGIADGSIRSLGTSPEDLALWVISSLAGGMFGARISGKAEDFNNVLNHLRHILFVN